MTVLDAVTKSDPNAGSQVALSGGDEEVGTPIEKFDDANDKANRG